MSTLTNEANDELHFRFEGEGITPVSIALRLEVLNAFPESVLAKLADVAWKSEGNETAGQTAANPLISKPLEIKPVETLSKDIIWSPILPKMIKDTYLWKFENTRDHSSKKESGAIKNSAKTSKKIDLPVDVDLQDALEVLDYYGLSIDDPEETFSFDQKSEGDQIRAKLFLKEFRNMEKATNFILQHLKRNPQRDTLFIFGDASLDMKYLNAERINTGDRDFVRVGSLDDCKDHAEWAQDDYLRDMIVSNLEHEGIASTFLNKDFTECSDGYWSPNLQVECNVEVRARQEHFTHYCEQCGSHRVLRVCVPVRERKRPRYSSIF